ncbi:hypothetical protein LOD99_9619 [Oopsacas minuta]|uniref:Uncharacterized protein n=1 Tax=Oopsacas minuta TaxID=111878 RepID=A0AAV7KKQ2_9METZ|nr:hypothetical protein LOD99_9619 [Oopsacas minuta]
MSGKIDPDAFNERTRTMPRPLYDGQIIVSENDKGERIEQRINPGWVAQINRARYNPRFIRVGMFSYDIDESGEPVPDPLFPDKHHPLCYCYRLLYDREELDPRVYCVGIPNDDDIVIYSDVLPDKTWKELKEEETTHYDLNSGFPIMQYKLLMREKKDPEEVFREYNERKRKEEIEKILKQREYEFTTDEDFLSLESIRDALPKDNTPNARAPRLVKQLPTLPIRNCKTAPRPPDYKPNRPTVGKKKKTKKTKRLLTPEERIYFEIHGCSYEQYIERKQKDIMKKLGAIDK